MEPHGFGAHKLRVDYLGVHKLEVPKPDRQYLGKYKLGLHELEKHALGG